MTRAVVALCASATLALGLAGCGGSTDDGPSATSTASNGDVFNTADVAFATEMIPHHAQAVQMVVLTEGRDLRPAVQRLAEQIRETQVPEVETLTDWLVAWDQDVPATTLDHANAGHDGEPPGTDSPSELTALADAPDAEFEDLWLTTMLEHHRGAVEMAQVEVDDGEHPGAVELATSIVESHGRQITELDDLLAS